MTLFKIDSQNRETRGIFRLFETIILTTSLYDGIPFMWFAVNIPLDLVPEISQVQGDIDIIVALANHPLPTGRMSGPTYRTFEVKAMTVSKEGDAKSLKVGKTRSIVKQLQKLKDYGSSEVILLELYILEDGYFDEFDFPNEKVRQAISDRASQVAVGKFGYKVLPFEHYEVEGGDFGLKSIRTSVVPYKSDIQVLMAEKQAQADPFSRLMIHLEDFRAKESKVRNAGYFQVITFCESCRELVLINGEIETVCYKCNTPLTDSTLSFEGMTDIG